MELKDFDPRLTEAIPPLHQLIELNPRLTEEILGLAMLLGICSAERRVSKDFQRLLDQIALLQDSLNPVVPRSSVHFDEIVDIRD